MAYIEINGLPNSLRMDGWWLSGSFQDQATAPPKITGPTLSELSFPFTSLALLALILLADWLFWGYSIGLSLAVFAVALTCAALLIRSSVPDRRTGVLAMLIATASVLPVIEYAQFLSLIFCFAGLCLMAAIIALNGRASLSEFFSGAVRFLTSGLLQTGLDVFRFSKRVRSTQGASDFRAQFLTNWLLPLGVGGIFVILLISGNPLVELWLEKLVSGFEFSFAPTRAAFWVAMACLIWPFLVIARLREKMVRPISVPLRTMTAPGFVTLASITNSLVLFNIIFAFQSVLDMTYLWGGAELPAQMTFAQYAHEGAYPLVATALLAGVFALISRPFAIGSKRLTMLLTVWIGQNVMLVLSSLLRLDLYVDSYGLTYLRVWAFLWMILVAIGLCLIAVQLFRGKSNLWLLQRNGLILVGVLYASCFVNFANVIADFNLNRASSIEQARRLDNTYVCGLGDMARPAIAKYEAENGSRVCYNANVASPEPNWREWGFRKWRVGRYVTAATPELGAKQ